MKSGVILTAAGLAGIAVLVGQMYAGAQPHREASRTARFADPGGVAGVIGPDVIVGSLPGTARWTGDGTQTAYSIATTSCNIGDEVLQWIDEGGSNLFPVIGQNLFRRSADGRFEQIGQSWLKHGFCALQGGLCASQVPGGCQPYCGGCCNHLGVGCSDPYSAGLNGAQSILGPKWQVNPYTGVFPLPYNPGEGITSSFSRRLIVQNVDLDAGMNPGALYFIEGHYVTQDDAAANNQNNNASYRQVVVGSAPNYSLSVTGSTQQQQQGIQAWQDFDPAVTLVDVPVVGDGLFILGYKASDNGDGTWHYEYALHNMNSDRAAGSFSVPIPACVTVTNEGFHDVDYHSGDGIGGANFDGTDWTITEGGSSITWNTQTFLENDNANALRWGTLYNYRFDADSPPTPVTVEIGLFKTGTAALVTAGAVGPTQRTLSPDITGPLSVPDGCVDAYDLGAMLAAWCSAVNDPNPPSPPCENCNPASLCLVDISGADMVPDGCVDAFDLAKLLAAWCSVAGGNPCGTCL